MSGHYRKILVNHSPLIDVADHNPKWYFQKFQGGGFPAIDISSSGRGGRSGSFVSKARKRGFAFSLVFTIVGRSETELVTNQSAFRSYFDFDSDIDSDWKTYSFVLADGSKRSIEAKVQTIDFADITPTTICTQEVVVQLISSREYFRSDDATQVITPYSGAGFNIPFAIPFDVSGAPQDQHDQALLNGGDTDSYPVVVIHGPLTTFNLTNDTYKLSISASNLPLSTTDTLMLDFYQRTAVKNKLNNVKHLITVQNNVWWKVKQGQNLLKFLASGGSGDQKPYVEVIYHSAWSGA